VFRNTLLAACTSVLLVTCIVPAQQAPSTVLAPIVLHAARLLQIDTGTLLTPGEILV
jgi:hypothetical protein